MASCNLLDFSTMNSSWLLLAAFLGAAEALAGNATDDQCSVNVPGYSHHGDCRLLCRPATWKDILLFYLVNYFAHAGTIITLPGQSVASSLSFTLGALLFPGGGVIRAMTIIGICPKLAPTPLQTAARAGALCAIVHRFGEEECHCEEASTGNHRSEEIDLHQQNTPGNQAADGRAEKAKARSVMTPPNTSMDRERIGQSAHHLTPLCIKAGRSNTSPSIAWKTICSQPTLAEPASIRSTKIHGRCCLPEGFDLMIVPPTATFENDGVASNKLSWRRRLLEAVRAPFRAEPGYPTAICCNYSVVKVIISVVQLFFAISTLYRTRGDQLDKYGYAAFGLTVAPYAWMTLVNLLANLLCPQYDAVFVVESSGYDELRYRLEQGTEEERAMFTVVGTVGRLTSSADEELQQAYTRARRGPTPSKKAPLSFRGPNLKIATSRLLTDFQAGLKRLLDPMELANGLAFWGPLIIVGAISRFQANQSALYQRVWTIMWLVFGIGLGVAGLIISYRLEDRPILNRKAPSSAPSLWVDVVITALYSAPAFGGYVVVAQMIKEFGVCSELRGVGGDLQG